MLTLSLSSFAQVHYYGDGIRDAFTPWASEFQGMCHDENNYFAVARYHLWRIPKKFAMEKVQNRHLKLGVTRVGIPEYLKAIGGHHMGDCDVHNGIVLVPLEGSWPIHKILVFDAKTLDLKGAPSLPAEHHDAPWITFDPDDGTIIMGTFDIKPGQSVLRYKFSSDFQSMQRSGKINLWDVNGNGIHLKRVQGADIIRSKNMLWLTSDTKAGGLYGFDLTTGLLVQHHPIQFSPGFPKYEELEGMDALEENEAELPHYKGNIFVTMLNSNLFKDSAYLKLFEY